MISDLDGQVITVKHIEIKANASLIVSAEVGLSQLFCNTIQVDKFGSLINKSQLFQYGKLKYSPFIDNNDWGSILNAGWAVNLVSSSQFGETGLLTVASDLGNGITNGEYFHNTGRIQVNNTGRHGIEVNGGDATFIERWYHQCI